MTHPLQTVQSCLLTTAGLAGGARLLRRLLRRAFPGAVRVLYCHDVLPDSGRCPTSLLPSSRGRARVEGYLHAAEFERRLLHLKRHYGFISLEQAIARLSGEERARGIRVLLTFDDGYRGVFDQGYPVLSRHGIPALICVATSEVGGPGLWTDAVRNAAGWLVLAGADALVEKLKRLPDADRRCAVDDLCRRAGPAIEQARRMLDWDELRRLASDPLIAIGAHTMTHPILSTQPDAEAEAEIAGSRREIERQLGIAPIAFAYPNGSAADFTPAHARMAQAAGFRVAFSTIPGLARPGCDLFAVGRTCLVNEPWPRFVLRMAGLDDLGARRARPAADAGAPVVARDG